MFGYVTPVKCRLAEGEWETYRAVYCGLCHTLKRRAGLPARFIINYDFTFLALLLAASEFGTSLATECRCCLAKPFHKQCVCVQNPALDRAADASIILFWWKLQDAISDTGKLTSLPLRACTLLFSHAYHAAAKREPVFAEQVRRCIGELFEMERACVASLDRPADTFARILQSLAELSKHEAQLSSLFYHLGRFIYLIDAWDDFSEDQKRHAYNPIAARFSLTEDTVPEEVQTQLKQTLSLSIRDAEQAFSQVDCGSYAGLLQNIINPGLPTVMERVARGEAPKKEKLSL